ncbi:hypothetical protein SAMN05216392_0383 [Streptococcus equinus]|uniref:Uncharacterized protein n=1 Tax=Streptococcus equinus TaxID=1335 RepID=A0A1H0Y2R1_STREI|nr:hypothetical protein [Streptococcus equinus]QBX24877.1 hypothetical protein Javan214_0040 [Streptococcus phage Javan214]SDQ09438.1 hypothetical protein SAMN05216392_0383 [Streptococcus equinus]
MIYITRDYSLENDDNKAFSIYSDYTCENLEYTCNYYEMLVAMQDSINDMVEEGLIDYQEAWYMRDDFIVYDEMVETLETFESEDY